MGQPGELPRPPRAGLPVWLGLMLALIAGLATWGGIQAVHPVFHVPKDAEAPTIGMAPEVYLKNRRAREAVERQHAMLYLGGLAGVVALVLGSADGALRKRYWAPLVSVPV